MTAARRSFALALFAALIGLAACAPRDSARLAPSPQVTPVPAPALPDFNLRLGSNRLAAVAATALGRRLYVGGQYWEVYVRTQPAELPGRYDPANPGAAVPSAARVNSAEVVMATESAVAIKLFAQGGEEHEREVLADLDRILRQDFPNLATDTIHIYYGERFEHGVAGFEHGRLQKYDVRKLG